MPAPAALVIFGSYARGAAQPDSDLDVLAVRPAGVAFDDDGWYDSIAEWTACAEMETGLTVDLIDAAVGELPELLGRPGRTVWHAISTEGWQVTGSPLEALAPG